MEQAVDAAQVYERAVVGEVLDDALDHLALSQGGEDLLAVGGVLGLDDGAAGDHDVVALLIELDDLELEFLALKRSGVAHRTDVDQRAGEECADAAQLNSEAALDLAVDGAVHGLLVVERVLELLPSLVALGLLAGQDGLAVAGLDRLERHVDGVADLDLELALGVLELLLGDLRLGLEAGVDDDEAVLNLDNLALDH